ncbi:hypothetical protein ACWEAF_17875, partial [Streptomyces sp. NPDC005071]
SRIAARAGGGVMRVFLILVGLFWLMPTIAAHRSIQTCYTDVLDTRFKRSYISWHDERDEHHH